MIRSILLPLDGSPFAFRAFPLALRLAIFHSARLALVTVHRPPRPALAQGASPTDSAHDSDPRESLQRHLDRAVSRARGAGCHDPQGYMLEGDVLDSLESFIGEHHVDLVVMTTHGRGGFSRTWLGSVAEGMLRHVSVPLLLTRARHAMPGRTDAPMPFSRVLVALDGSPNGERAIDEVIRLCGTAPLHLTLAHVVQPVQTLLSPMLGSLPEGDVRTGYLEPLAARVREARRSVSVEVVLHGHVPRALLNIAKGDGADLIALSSSGAGGLPRLLMGSVADKIIRTSPVPVLVHVPRSASGRPG